MKRLTSTIITLLAAATTAAAQGLSVQYKSYERIPYVSNPIDTATQCLSIYEPQDAKPDAPILLKTYTTDFRSTTPQPPSANDETALALKNGIVVCIVGTRGYNTMKISTTEKINKKKKKKKNKNITVDTDVAYCGKLPAPLIDLKAAVRYLRLNDNTLPGSSEKIIATGSMAGGGLAALLGATADDPIYAPLLTAAGAADASDLVYAVACIEPLTNPMNAASSGEWLTDYKGDYPQYIDFLAMLVPETETPLNSNNYHKYLKEILYNSTRTNLDNGTEIPDELGAVYFGDSNDSDIAQYLVDFNIGTYLQYIKSNAYKTGYRHYFTTLSAKLFGEKTADEYSLALRQMDIARGLSRTSQPVAQKWYIRHNATDTAIPLTESVTLATMLENLGQDLDFDIQWEPAKASELVKWILKN